MALVRCSIFCAMLLIAMSVAARSQSPSNVVVGTEIFVTMDAEAGNPPWSCQWMNFVFRDLDGNLEPFNHFLGMAGIVPPLSPPTPPVLFPQWGFGTWGPIYKGGNVFLEPFWLSATLGNLGGHIHSEFFAVANPPFPNVFLVYEDHPGVAGQRQGFRFTRVDGRAFSLASLDYRLAQADFQIGTELMWYSSFPGYARFSPPIPGSLDFETLQFPEPPESITEIAFGDTGGPGLMTFSPFGTFTSAGTPVIAVQRPSGVIVDDPTADPLILGMATISGTYVGTDFSRFSDIQLTNATLTLTTTTGEVLTATTTYSPAMLDWSLIGPLASRPVVDRIMTADAGCQVTRSGSGSTMIESLAFLLKHDPVFHLRIRMTAVGPRLLSFARGPLPSPPTGVTHTFVTDGTGNLQIGVIDAVPNGEIRHLIQLSPMGALGGGPLFGLDFTTELLVQLQLPLGIHPFCVNVNGEGMYQWMLPSGTIPLGVIADVVFVQMTTPVMTVSAPLRIVF